MNLSPTTTKRDYHRKALPWWYERIIDEMIADPSIKLAALAKKLGRQPGTLSSIINTDMFKVHYNQRKARYALQFDMGIMEKNAKIAHSALDHIATILDKKKDTIPLALLNEVAEGSLKRLGYGVETPQGAFSLNVNVNNGTQVVVPPTVSRSDLDEARMALRQVQESKRVTTAPSASLMIDVTPTKEAAE